MNIGPTDRRKEYFTQKNCIATFDLCNKINKVISRQVGPIL